MRLKAHSRPKSSSWKKKESTSTSASKSSKNSVAPGEEAVLTVPPSPTAEALSEASSPSLPLLLALLTVVSLPIIANLAAGVSPKLLASTIGFHVGPLRPPVCQPLTKGIKTSLGLPSLYFIAGADGAGHNFFTTVFSLIKDKANITIEKFDPTVHVTAANTQVADSSAVERFKGCPKLPYSRQAYDFGAEITSRLAALQETSGVPFRGLYVRTRDTFPLAHSLETPLDRPDLLSISMFDGIMYNLKVIVLVRNPADIMAERITNKTYSDDPGLLFRTTEDSLTYLDASVRQLPCGSYIAVNMDSLMGSFPEGAPNESPLASALAEFLGIPGIDAAEMQASLSRSRSLSAKPASQRRRLMSLETESELSAERVISRRVLQAGNDSTGGGMKGNNEEAIKSWKKEFEDKTSPRFLLWPLLSAVEGVPYFLPRDQTDWPQ